VAADVARILSRTPEELAATDIADYALEALSASRIREVYVLGRRGPAQAAFTNPEVRELGELAGADITALPDEVELDELTRQALERAPDRATQKKVEILKEYARRAPTGKPRRLVMRFLVSPVELRDDGTGAVGGMRLVRNRLYATATGTLQPKATGEFEDLPVGLVFRSVGYRGVPLPGVPFNDDWGVILNDKGRVLDPQTKHPLVGSTPRAGSSVGRPASSAPTSRTRWRRWPAWSKTWRATSTCGRPLRRRRRSNGSSASGSRSICRTRTGSGSTRSKRVAARKPESRV